MVWDVSGKNKIAHHLWAVISQRCWCTGESSNLVMVNQNLSDHDVLALLPVIEPWTKKTPNQCHANGTHTLESFGQTMVVIPDFELREDLKLDAGHIFVFFGMKTVDFEIVFCALKNWMFRFMDIVCYVCMFNTYYVTLCSERTLVPSRQMSSSLFLV